MMLLTPASQRYCRPDRPHCNHECEYVRLIKLKCEGEIKADLEVLDKAVLIHSEVAGLEGGDNRDHQALELEMLLSRHGSG